MLELKTKVLPKSEELNTRKLFFFIQSRLYILIGKWDWDLQTDELFCSDVFFTLSEGSYTEATKSLIYPDDLSLLKEELEKTQRNNTADYNFRIITTYGKVHSVKGKGHFQIEINDDISSMINDQGRMFLKEKELRKEFEQNELELNTYQFAEQLTKSGIWYINTITHETFYSNNIYRIYGLPPQSVNAHYHTFTSFIHPEDSELVTEAFDKAYREQLPIQLNYRIIINKSEIRNISQITRWIFNDKGEMIITGVVEDVTGQVTQEQEFDQFKNDLLLKDHMLTHAEQMGKIANWHLNLFTRKITYTENIYRIYGLKPQERPIISNTLMKLVHPDDQQLMIEVNRKILYEHIAPDAEFRIVRPDGKIRYLHQKGKMIINEFDEMIMIGTIHDITELKAGEKRLKKLQSEYNILDFTSKQAEELAGLGSWLWDINSGETAWSNGIYHVLGYKNYSLQLSQKILLNFIHPDDRKKFNDHVNLVVEGLPETSFDFRMIRKGEISYIHAQFKLIKEDDKVIFVGIVREITRENNLYKQYQEQLGMAEMLSDASIDRVFVTDINNYIIKWNRKCEEEYGIKKEKAIGKNLFDLFPQLNTPEILSYYLQVLRGEQIYLKDQKSVLTSGHNDLNMIPIKDENDQVNAVLTMVHNTTREYELKRQLTERLQFIEMILEASIDRIIVLDRNMNYMYWNKRAEEYYDLKKEQVLGKNILEVFPALINDPSYQEFRQALRGDTVHINANKNLESKKGYFETYLIPIKDEKKEVIGILWIVHDLTKEFILLRQQKKAQSILDTINEGCYELDVEDFRFKYINRKAAEFLNMPIENMLGRSIYDVFPGIFDSQPGKAILQANEKRITVSGEYFSPILKKWIYQTATPSDNGVIVLFLDIQNFKEVQDKQLTNESNLKSAQAIASMGSYEYDLSKNEIILSDETCNICDYPPGTTITFEDINKKIHPDDLKLVYQLTDNLTKKPKEYYDTYFRIIVRDSEIRHLHTRGRVVFSPEGTALRIIGIVQDITEQKLAEERLQEQENFIRHIADATPDLIHVFDLSKNKLVYINKEIFPLLGYTSTELMQMDLDEYKRKLVHPDDWGKMEAFHVGFFNAGGEEILEEDTRQRNKNGEWIWLRTRGKIFKRDKEGKPSQYIAISQDITARKRAVEELRQSEERFRTLANAMPAIVWLTSANGNAVYFNDRTYEYTGKSHKELADFGWGDFVHPDDKNETLRIWNNSLRTGENYEVKFRIRRFDGTYCWHLSRAKPVRDESGRIIMWAGATIDIDDQVKAEVDLNLAHRDLTMLNKIYEYAEGIASLGTWTWDPNTNKAFYSMNMYHLFDIDPKSLKSEDGDIMLNRAVRLKDGNEPASSEYSIKKHDGIHYFRNKCKLHDTEEGNNIFIGTTQDITDEVNLRNQLIERTLYAESIIDASIDRITVFDKGYRFVAWNRHCSELNNIKKEDAIGKSIFEVFPQVINDSVLMDAQERSLSGEYVHISVKKDLYLNSYCELFYIPLKNADGETYAVVNIMHDISDLIRNSEELKDLNSSLEKKNIELAEKNEEITSFAFVSNHDLKEPLRKMHTFSDWLLQNELEKMSPEGKGFMKKMNASIRRLDLLLDDILVLTKIHSDKNKNEEVDLNVVLKKVRLELEEYITQNKVLIEAANMPTIKGNKNQLFYLFSNLIINAIKFQLPGNIPKIKIWVQEINAGVLVMRGINKEIKYLKISFADNGMGFDSKYKKKIFQMFQQLHQKNDFEGTGMGLAICKKIMENHEGFIDVISEEGKGSVFSCYFPMESTN